MWGQDSRGVTASQNHLKDPESPTSPPPTPTFHPSPFNAGHAWAQGADGAGTRVWGREVRGQHAPRAPSFPLLSPWPLRHLRPTARSAEPPSPPTWRTAGAGLPPPSQVSAAPRRPPAPPAPPNPSNPPLHPAGDAVLRFEVHLVALSRAGGWRRALDRLLPLLCLALLPALLGLIGFHLYRKAGSPKTSKKKQKEEKRNKAKKK